jgi:hypothetical protein
MSETPRTDAVFASTDHVGIMFDFARTLERELAAVKAENERLLRGEFICRECGIRKNDTHPKGDF